MKFKVVLTIAALVLLGVKEIRAQVPSFASEALFLSRTQPGGTARILGMGGSQTALGGDISSASSNPAGLGMYNRSEFSFTPGYTMTSSASSYLGNTDNQSKNTLIIPNLGMAFHKGKEGTTGFLGGTFGVSYNRISDYNNTFTYHGKNNDNSIIDYFLNNADGDTEAQFDSNINSPGYNYNTPTGLAYNNYLIGPETAINPTGDPTRYFTDVYPYLPTQTEVVKTTGSQGQWNFSYGANFSDKFFVGLGIGLASFKYKSEAVYSETFLDPFPSATPPVSPMSKLILNESFNMTGTGINATLGAIFRPLDLVQIGLSIATPTSYQISSEYIASMNTTWQNFEYTPGTILNNVSYKTDLVSFQHNLSTPWKFNGGFAFFIVKKAIITGNVEYVSYGSSKYSSYSDGSSSNFDNQNIKNLYNDVFNLRMGGEFRLNNYRFRVGGSVMPDPYKTLQNDVSVDYYSGSIGFGYRTSEFYIDLAGIYGWTSNSYRPYNVPSNTSPLVTMKNQSTTIAFTVGFPF